MPDEQTTPEREVKPETEASAGPSVHQKLLEEKFNQFKELKDSFIKEGFDIIAEPVPVPLNTPHGTTVRWTARIVIMPLDERKRQTLLKKNSSAANA